MTGLSFSTRCVRRGNAPSGSKSASSFRSFDSSCRFVSSGIELTRVGWIEETRLRASRRVRIRGLRGKFPRIWMSLSTRSMASCGCCVIASRALISYESTMRDCPSKGKIAGEGLAEDDAAVRCDGKVEGQKLTPATPKFSMAGIRCPVQARNQSLSTLPTIKSVVSVLFCTYLGGRARAPSARSTTRGSSGGARP